MARYFLHLRDGASELLDLDGIECSDAEALRRAVLANARDTMGNEVKSTGMLDLRYRIDAEDEAGSIVHSLAFTQAVKVMSCSKLK